MVFLINISSQTNKSNIRQVYRQIERFMHISLN